FRCVVHRVFYIGEILETSGEGSPVVHTLGIAYILGNNVNVRKGPDTSYSVICQLNKPEAFQVWGEKDGWRTLGGAQWVRH
ncbi:SH3 domain-containing protein, partial [Bacillus cereus]|uniref:SH3 domain-containing protein n=1 Tax=Bacillus cereus TaxID=1396 RepID=UPI0018F5A236|nr:SH3 domain-containing protein [Bacillus cereus]